MPTKCIGFVVNARQISADGQGGNGVPGATAATSDKLYCNPGHGYIFQMDGKVRISC